MKDSECKECGKVSYGSNRRDFCSSACRAAYWHKNNPSGKAKPKIPRVRIIEVVKEVAKEETPKTGLIRPNLPKLDRLSVEQLQFRVLGDLKVLEGYAEDGDSLAFDTLVEAHRVINNIAGRFQT